MQSTAGAPHGCGPQGEGTGLRQRLEGCCAPPAAPAFCAPSYPPHHSLPWPSPVPQINAAVLDEALGACELLRVEPQFSSPRSNATARQFSVTAVSVSGADLVVLTFVLTKAKGMKRGDVCAVSCLGEAHNAQATTTLESVRFQRVPLGALQPAVGASRGGGLCMQRPCRRLGGHVGLPLLRCC